MPVRRCAAPGRSVGVSLHSVDRVRLSQVIKAYDVRGTVPDQINEPVAEALGRAFAEVVALPDGAPGVVVGYDMRPSSPSLAAAFADGICRRGLDVTMIGLASTDGLYYASGALDLPGAMFTASHNPAQYNGLKLCRAGARPVGQDTGLRQLERAAQALLDAAEGAEDAPEDATEDADAAPGTIRERDLTADYGAFLRGLVDLSSIRPLRVVIDAGNGMAGHTAPVVLAGLPIEVLPMYFELDGSFPNHEANPLEPANLVDLQRAVVEHRADLGLAFDGDADRCAVIDEQGRAVSASAITALVAEREIAREIAAGVPADRVCVVYNVISSLTVPETIAAAGARGVRTRVGHSFVKAEMAAHHAVFGGEHSAHYYFREFWFADTGMLAAMHVLAALGEQDRPLSDLVGRYQRYPASGEINSTVDDVVAATDRVAQWAGHFPIETDHVDGLTVTHTGSPMWWFNLRPSNTEPLLRLNVEAADESTLAEVRDRVLALVRAGEHGRPDPAQRRPSAPTGLDGWLREILRCPVGLHELVDAVGPDGAAELHCAVDCGGPGRRLAYRVDDGIPVLLAEEARAFSLP